MSSSRTNYKRERKDLRDTFDPHLAVDPEDRPYLTMDLTDEHDDLPRDLRRNARNRPATGRYLERDIGEALDPHLAVDPEDRAYLLDEYGDDSREIRRRGKGSMSMSRRDIGEALDTFDPHLAVDPEDRPYLLDKYEDDSRRGKGSRSKAERKTDESYRARKDKDYEKRREISALPSSKTDIICIDGSAGADRAMLYAARNLPKDHTLLLVHGVHSWMGSSISETDKPDILELEDHYESLCKRAGRDCRFKHFSFTTTSGFGDEVCRIADKKGAASVVIGRRENVSDMRRKLMGSSSNAVMNNCYVPVTIVGTAINNTKTKQY